MKKHVFLTGFMGAGKSRIGRALAAEWNWPFYDTDALIERETGRTIMQLFEEKGESFFRQKEAQIIGRISAEAYPAVISLGGGALMQKQNFKIIGESGLLIYIKSAPEKILERVKHSDKRPLLKVEKDASFNNRLLNKIIKMLEQREPVYARADVVYLRDGLEPEQIVPELSGLIRQKWEEENEND